MYTYKEYCLLDEETKKKEKDARHMHKMVNDIKWVDVFDLYGDDQAVEVTSDDDNLINEEVYSEAISMRVRLARSLAMKKNAYKMALARKIKLIKMSDDAGLQKRANVAARRAMFKKFLSGRNISELSSQEKAMIEDRISGKKHFVSSLAKRMMPRIRTIERSRLIHRR